MVSKESLRKTVFSLVVLVVLVSPLFYYSRIRWRSANRHWLIWNTVADITAYAHEREEVIYQKINTLYQEVELIDRLMNVYQPKSELARLHAKLAQGQTGPFQVSPATFEVLQLSQKIARLSQGAFDVTVRPLIQLWKKRGRQGRLPSTAEIQAVKRRVGYQKMHLDPHKHTVSFANSGMSVDLGGIVKGYAVDLMIARLRRSGLPAGMVNIGGDLRAYGHPPAKQHWVVGIQDPRIKNPYAPPSYIGLIAIDEEAVTTSGHYRRFITIKGKRYSHIIDPRCGQPVQNKIVSVTVIAPQAVLADALSTAICVLGVAPGLKFLEQFKRTEALVITITKTDELEFFQSPGFEKYWLKKPLGMTKGAPNDQKRESAGGRNQG